jgi:hypothetical protein
MRVRTDRRSSRAALTLVALGLLMAAGLPALAGAVPGPGRVKYYLVAAGPDGTAETLAAIALDLLGAEDRAEEIIELNEGRTQPDGGVLTRGAPLRVGWVLVLPWDAVGDGVRYGVLGGSAPTTPPTSATSAPPPTAGPSSPPTAGPTVPAGAACPGLVPSAPAAGGAGSPWAQQRLSPQDAWPAAGRGSGVVVAVVDSGVDARVPQLSGRVSAGVDVVTGTGSGTIDCLGTGTAMAALIVADDPQQVLGVAPDATVMPVRLTVDQASATAIDQATAIDVAVSAGARVIALGSYVDFSIPGVRRAVNNAASHEVVVVVAGPVRDEGAVPPQLLRVGALNRDGRLARDYPAGTIDVVAPGQDVASVGPGGQGRVQVSGAQYAVALVAGAAALVRGAAPNLPAQEVVERLRTTATPLDPGDAGSADAGRVALVNLTKAVLAASPDATARATAPHGDDGAGSLPVLLSAGVVALLVVGGGVLLLRRRILPDGAPPKPSRLDQ